MDPGLILTCLGVMGATGCLPWVRCPLPCVGSASGLAEVGVEVAVGSQGQSRAAAQCRRAVTTGRAWLGLADR